MPRDNPLLETAAHNIMATEQATIPKSMPSRRIEEAAAGAHAHPFPQRSSITEYTSNELARLISWVTSDGQLRTDDEVLREMVEVLGFKRRGARIDLRLRQAIQQWRGRTGV